MTIIVWALMLAALAFAASKAFRQPTVFVIFLLAGGSLRFGSEAGNVAGGTLDLSALWLLCLIGLCIVAILRSRAFDERLALPERLYLLFLAWCMIEALRAPSPPFAVRGFLKLLYPLLIMILARTVIRSPSVGTTLLKWVLGCAFATYLLVGGVTQRFFGAVTFAVEPFFWEVAAFADYAAIMTIVALACWDFFRDRKYLYLALLLGTSSAFVSIRTGILAVAIGGGAYAVSRWGMRSVPALVGLYLLAGGALFLLPDTRAKMFNDEKTAGSAELVLHPGELSAEDIDSSGRFTMWQVVMDKFFWPDPIIGSGLGATQAWFYGGGYTQVKVEHSEYVKLLSDTGVVGLGLFLASLLSAGFSAWRIYRKATPGVVKVFALATIATVPAFMICMAFDNALLYVCAAAQYPFALGAISIGLDRRQPSITTAPPARPHRMQPPPPPARRPGVRGNVKPLLPDGIATAPKAD